MAEKQRFFRYNPSKAAPGRPWQVKIGRSGRASRTRTVSGILTDRQRRTFKASPGEWFPDV